MQRRVLRPAILALLQAGPEELNFRDDRAGPRIQEFERGVDDIFFDHLLDVADEPGDGSALRWVRAVHGIAEQILEEATKAIPLPIARRYRAIAQAERTFRGASRRQFPDLISAAAKEGFS